MASYNLEQLAGQYIPNQLELYQQQQQLPQGCWQQQWQQYGSDYEYWQQRQQQTHTVVFNKYLISSADYIELKNKGFALWQEIALATEGSEFILSPSEYLCLCLYIGYSLQVASMVIGFNNILVMRNDSKE